MTPKLVGKGAKRLQMNEKNVGVSTALPSANYTNHRLGGALVVSLYAKREVLDDELTTPLEKN